MPIKKYSKVKFAFRKELIIILAVIVVMVIATVLLQLPSKEDKFIKEWSSAGSSIVENDLYETISFDKLDNVLDKAEGVVFVYFATSSDETSVTNFDVIMSQADLFGVEKVYLVDAKNYQGDREEDAELDEKLTAIENRFTAEDGTAISLDYTPNLWAFENGKLVKEINHDLIDTNGDWKEACKQVLILARQ